MKEVLIIRSASFQQLDKNMEAIEKRYKGHKISMLTHEHGVKLAEKYKNIDKVYVYPYKDGFKYSQRVEELRDKEFETVIIPVTNISGAGFFNVLLFSLTVKAKKRVICNLVSDIWEISKPKIISTGIKNALISGLSRFISLICGVFVSILLPFKLRYIEKKE